MAASRREAHLAQEGLGDEEAGDAASGHTLGQEEPFVADAHRDVVRRRRAHQQQARRVDAERDGHVEVEQRVVDPLEELEEDRHQQRLREEKGDGGPGFSDAASNESMREAHRADGEEDRECGCGDGVHLERGRHRPLLCYRHVGKAVGEHEDGVGKTGLGVSG